MALFDTIFGGGTTGASEAGLAAQIAANAETAAFIEQQAGIARGDISGALPQQISAFQGGAAQAQGQLAPFSTQGLSAFNLQSALSGAGGGAAQQQAFQDFISSPGQQFLREQGEQSLLRSASAIGGLGGGNVRSELERQGIGFAAQDFANQFNRLGSLSQIGASAAGQQAGLSQQAGAGLADIRGQGAGALANIATGAAQQRVGLPGLPGLQRDPGILQNVGSLASGIGTGLQALGLAGSGASALGLAGGGAAAAGLGTAGAAGLGATSALGGSGAALAGGAGALTAPGALAPAAVSVAPLTGAGAGAGAAGAGAAPSFFSGAAGAGAGGLASIGAGLAAVGLGAFGGVPSGKETVRRAEEARQSRILEPILRQLELDDPTPPGMTRLQFLLSKNPNKFVTVREEGNS